MFRVAQKQKSNLIFVPRTSDTWQPYQRVPLNVSDSVIKRHTGTHSGAIILFLNKAVSKACSFNYQLIFDRVLMRSN